MRTRLTYFDFSAGTAVPSIRLIPDYDSTLYCRETSLIDPAMGVLSAIGLISTVRNFYSYTGEAGPLRIWKGAGEGLCSSPPAF